MLGRVSMAMFTGFLMWGLLSMSPALADEFEVAIVIGEDVDASEFMDGFQLAVNESPDVSHPPDIEGGDHLGSMDVVWSVSTGGAIPDAGDSPIVVADLAADSLEAVQERTARSPAMLLIFTDFVPADLAAPSGVFTVERTRAQEFALILSPSFETDFAVLHGYQPSPSAARGYTAGKLVDVAVEATDRDPTDVATLMAALEAETAGETGPETTTLPTTSTSTPATSEGRSLVPPGLIAVIVVVLAIVGVMYIRDSRRREPSDRS